MAGLKKRAIGAAIAGTIVIAAVSVPSGNPARPAMSLPTNTVEEIDELLKPYEPKPTRRSVMIARQLKADLNSVLADSVDTKKKVRKPKNLFNDEVYLVVKKADKKAFLKAFADTYCAPLASTTKLRRYLRECRKAQQDTLTTPQCNKKTKQGVVIGFTATMRINKRMLDNFTTALPAGTMFTKKADAKAAANALLFKDCYDEPTP